MTSLSRTPTMRKSRERETKGTQMDIMLKRREMIAVGSQEMDDSDTEWEDEDDGAVSSFSIFITNCASYRTNTYMNELVIWLD